MAFPAAQHKGGTSVLIALGMPKGKPKPGEPTATPESERDPDEQARIAGQAALDAIKRGDPVAFARAVASCAACGEYASEEESLESA